MIRRLWKQIGSGKFLLFWGIALLYAIGARRTAPPDLISRLLDVLNDDYYAVFAVLPVLLVLLGSALEEDPTPVILRYGSYRRYFRARVLNMGILVTILWAGQLLALTIGLWGGPLSTAWPVQSGHVTLWGDRFALMETIFPSPAAALLAAAVWLLAGYWFCSSLCLWLGHVLPRIRAIQVLMALYILSVLYIKMYVFSQPPLLYFTSLCHWVLLLYNLNAPGRLLVTAVFTVAVIALIVWSVNTHWQIAPHLPRQPRGLAALFRRELFTPKSLLYTGVLFLLLPAWGFSLSGMPARGRDWTVILLAGHGSGTFWFVGLMAQLISQVLPLWPLGQQISSAMQMRSCMFTVRLRRRSDLLTGLYAVSLLWLLFCTGLLLAAELLPLLFWGIRPDWPLVLWTAALRFLDSLFQVLLLIVLLCLTGQTAVAFTLLVLSHLLTVLPLPLLPVGISSLLRLSLSETGGGVAPVCAAGVLAAGCVLLLLWLRRFGVRYLFQRNGG